MQAQVAECPVDQIVWHAFSEPRVSEVFVLQPWPKGQEVVVVAHKVCNGEQEDPNIWQGGAPDIPIEEEVEAWNLPVEIIDGGVSGSSDQILISV